MANVIDSLVLEFGLDPKNFTRGQKQVVDDLHKVEEQATKTSKNVEARGKQLAQYFVNARNQIIGLFAAFTAGKGLKEFIIDLTSSDLAIGRLSVRIGLSVHEIAKQRAAMRLFGGSVDDVTGSMQSLVDSIQEYSVTGQSAIIPYLRALKLNISDLVDASGALRPDWIVNIRNAVKGLSPERAGYFLRNLGLGPDTINQILLTDDAFKKLQEDAAKKAVTDQADADAAEKRQKAWGDFIIQADEIGRVISTKVTPMLVKFLDKLTEISDWFIAHPKVALAIFIALGAAVAALTAIITVGLVSGALASVAAAFALLINPITWIIAMLGVLGYAATKMGLDWTKVWKNCTDVIQEAWDVFKGFNDYVKGVGTFFTGGGQAAAPSKPASAGASTGGSQSDQDIQALMGFGWSKAQAQGIVANLSRESSGNIRAKNGDHYGLAQWDPGRQAEFAKKYGHPIEQSTRDEQLSFINFELRGTEIAAGRRLAKEVTPEGSAGVVAKYYERTDNLDSETAKRIAAASILSNGPLALSNARPGVGGGASTRNSTSQTSIGTINIITKATDANGIAQDLNKALRDRQLGAQADSGPA